MASSRRLLVAVCLAGLAALPAGARPDPGPSATPEEICAFRHGTVQALFSAANELSLARQAFAEDDSAGAAAWLEDAARRLDDDKRRVAQKGGPYLRGSDRKLLKRSLKNARKPAKKALRLALRKPGETEIPLAEAEFRIGALLGEQSAAQGDLACAGGELRVQRLHVRASETPRLVPSGAVIVAEQGIELQGDLVTAGAPAGGLGLVAETGDVVLEGTIDASGEEALGLAPLAAAPLESLDRGPLSRAAEARGLAPATCGDGGNLEIAALTGDLVIGARHYAIAGAGADCPALLVTSLGQLDPEPLGDFLEYRGRKGGDGGRVLLAAPSGTIRFAARSQSDPAPFSPGSGGAGQDLTFAPAFDLSALPPFATLGAAGGFGGDSGWLEAAGGVGLGQLPRFYREGAGGDGGDLVWNQRGGTALLPNGLTSLELRGGVGGWGVAKGGGGGDVQYQGDRVVNAPGAEVTVVFGRGGPGGWRELTVLYGPLDLFEGGAGGDADVVGHRGWNGDELHPNAGAGGNALVYGGAGGQPTDLCPPCQGGAGGNASGRGGDGGDGWPSCGEPLGAGGDGGGGGSVSVNGGAGADADLGSGGDGGSVLLVETGRPGRGGDGLPPGRCGSDGDAIVREGPGGEGGILGATGTVVEPVYPVCDGGNPAGARGVGPVTCEEPPPPPPPDCDHPWSLSYFVSETIPANPAYFREFTYSAVEMCSGGECGIWHTSVSGVSWNGATGETEPFAYGVDAFVLPTGSGLVFDHCTPQGALHPGGGGGTDDNGSRVTVHACGGSSCECLYSGYVGCCPGIGGSGWRLDDDAICE